MKLFTLEGGIFILFLLSLSFSSLDYLPLLENDFLSGLDFSPPGLGECKTYDECFDTEQACENLLVNCVRVSEEFSESCGSYFMRAYDLECIFLLDEVESRCENANEICLENELCWQEYLGCSHDY